MNKRQSDFGASVISSAKYKAEQDRKNKVAVAMLHLQAIALPDPSATYAPIKPTPAPAEVLARAQAKAKRESLELAMYQQLRACGLTFGLQREWKFHTRRWRFDFAYPDPAYLLAVEVEGGTWSVSRHTTGAGFQADAEKYAQAAILGWRVIRLTSGQVVSGIGVGWVEQALGPAYKRMAGIS